MATTVQATGSVHTHSVSHAHFLCTFCLRDVQTSPKRMAQGVYVISLHLALSILMFHPPSLLFPDGHFDTTFPSAPSSSRFTRPKCAGQAHLRTCAGEFGYLADPTHLGRVRGERVGEPGALNEPPAGYAGGAGYSGYRSYPLSFSSCSTRLSTVPTRA